MNGTEINRISEKASKKVVNAIFILLIEIFFIISGFIFWIEKIINYIGL